MNKADIMKKAAALLADNSTTEGERAAAAKVINKYGNPVNEGYLNSTEDDAEYGYLLQRARNIYSAKE